MPIGKLFIVATPIGNLEDITYRAVRVLQTVDTALVEDTRQSKKLFSRYAIGTRLVALHDHNERHVAERALNWLCAGQSLALISDAGTPLISDPGYVLVQSALEGGIHVVPIPGPSAIITALCAAGLPAHRFVFEGFLPPKEGDRKRIMKLWRDEEQTVVYYEAAHRLLRSLISLLESVGSHRRVVVAKELTKAFETFYRGSIEEVIETIHTDPNARRGEFVILLEGITSSDRNISEVKIDKDHLLTVLAQELSPSQATRIAHLLTKERKNSLYQQIISLTTTQ